MNKELDEILNGPEKNPAKQEVDRMISLLQDLRVEFRQSMETVFKPVYKTKEDPIDVILLPDLKVSEKLIMVILRNRKEVTVEQLIIYCDMKKNSINRSLNNLRNLGYVIKLKVGTYAINETKIY